MEYTYSHLPPSKPAPRRRKSEKVFRVGARAFVDWVQPSGQTPLPVPMVDGAGQPIANDLRDGQEVEILSWRPGAREGVLYQVRRAVDRSEWWISVEYLRCEVVKIATESSAEAKG
jgi:hypothetical protein